MDYTGTFQNGMIQPDGPVSLPDGTRVQFHRVGQSPSSIEELRALSSRFFGSSTTQPSTSTPAPVDLWPEEDSIDEFLAFVRLARR